MIILPDKNIVRTKFLIPVPVKEWREPSHSLQRDQMGNTNCTKFRIMARLNDGYIKWVSWFDSRDDFDAFLWALAKKTLKWERALWSLCTPAWHPDIGEELSYEFATLTFYTTPTGSNQTWTRPTDWNASSNSIEGIGGGGSGAGRFGSVNIADTGGGGGAYAKILNFNAATATYQIGAGGAGVVIGVAGGNAGNPGGATWFNSTVDPGGGTDNTKLAADNGSGGTDGTGSGQAGGAGGTTANSWGSTKFAGGNGGSISPTSASNNLMSGGGGAGGTTGAGSNGATISTGGLTSSAGGAGGATSGGTAGTSNGGTGGNGSVWAANFGAGGGGGGRVNGTPGGSGGNYGGGGGASSGGGATTTTGAGIQGIIVTTYTPPVNGFNMPILGL